MRWSHDFEFVRSILASVQFILFSLLISSVSVDYLRIGELKGEKEPQLCYMGRNSLNLLKIFIKLGIELFNIEIAQTFSYSN